MNREIKFRAWDSRTREWLGAFGIHKTGLFQESSNNKWNEMKDSVIIFNQFTGVLDKDGVEVYEGDIVINCYPSVQSKKKKMKVISWKTRGKTGTGFNISSLTKVKVIGNVYENPDLLK